MLNLEVKEFLENYGWYVLIVSIISIVLYNKKLKPLLDKYREYKFNQEYSAKYHKNPDIFASHVNAQQSWIEKMQEKYNEESKKMKEKEEKKKQEFLRKKYENDTPDGYVLGSKNEDNNNKKRSLGLDYNPLMGAGSSSSYRPPRRSPCGSGGCGR